MSSVADLLRREREEFRSTVLRAGFDAPTACGGWTAGDLAVHLATGELAWAVPSAPLRWLVSRGVRLDRLAGVNTRVLERYRRRHDPPWASRRLERDPPWLHRHGAIAAVSLLEVWAHHEDVLATTGLGPCGSDIGMEPVVAVLVRYQRSVLDQHGTRLSSGATVWHEPASPPRARIDGRVEDVARWLSGRGPLDSLEKAGDQDALEALARERLRI